MTNIPTKKGSKVCFTCWKELEGNPDLCPCCGKDLKPTVCKQCGARVEKTNPICPACKREWNVERKPIDPSIINLHPFETEYES